MDNAMAGIGNRWYSATIFVLGVAVSISSSAASEAVALSLIAFTFFVINGSALELPRGGVIPLFGGIAVAAASLLAPPQAVGAMLLGIGGAGLMRPIGRDKTFTSLLDLAPRVIALYLLSSVLNYGLPASAASDSLMHGAMLLAGGIAFMLVDLTAYSAARGGFDVASGLTATGGLIKVLGAGYVAQVSVGAVLVLVYPRLDFFAFLVLVPLMLIMQHTTGMLLKVRAAYMRTIGVLAEVAEMQSDKQHGHAERVSALATHIGRVLRIGSQQLERLALASLLHDIGMLRNAQTTDMDTLAESGAAVVSRVSFLASLSPIIQKQSAAYRQFLDPLESDGRLARIIRLASDVDDLAQEGGDSTDREILARIDSKADGIYDPQVVQALCRVVEHRGIAR
ncbi:MAG: hypothetical protein KJ747_00945 [Actinobacteria bacterium]|nr:hypothetical protein [Actinomycetota bacterium]MCG2806697.1 hypothetical protein [Coriobacteriia bacterium]